MAVTVIRGYYNTGQPAERDVYDEGQGVDVQEGHLWVKGGSPTIVLAVYAPGSWIQVVRDDHSAFTRAE